MTNSNSFHNIIRVSPVKEASEIKAVFLNQGKLRRSQSLLSISVFCAPAG